jgi:hypothetical protein
MQFEFKAEFDDLDITSEAVDFDEVGGSCLFSAVVFRSFLGFKLLVLSFQTI